MARVEIMVWKDYRKLRDEGLKESYYETAIRLDSTVSQIETLDQHYKLEKEYAERTKNNRPSSNGKAE